jgi:O-antigen/teichoic acid export membrane protein
MSRLRHNVIANIAGQGWAALMAVLVVPLYIKLVGIEAYGLIGFFVMLQGLLVILDLGLGQTLNREMARYSALPDTLKGTRNLLRTLEIVYWIVGLVIGASIAILSPVIAQHWIKAQTLSQETVQRAVLMMGLVVAMQWPVSLYLSGLMGLQRQVLVNAIRIATSTLAGVGGVAVLALLSRDIVTLFIWQVVVAGMSVVLAAFMLWRQLSLGGHQPHFSSVVLQRVKRFAAGMTGITITGIILIQADRVVLSNLLSLDRFAYYTLAWVVANGMYVFIAPIFSSFSPRFAALAAQGDTAGLRSLYHQGSQLMAALIAPVAAVLFFCSYEVVELWTGTAETATNAAPIVSLLIVGTTLNGLMNLPYALQLAHGRTGIGLAINLVLIVLAFPALIFMATTYGGIGGATVWAGLNALYLLVGIPVTHHKLMPDATLNWLVRDIALPFIVTVLVVVVLRSILGTGADRVETVLHLFMISMAALTASMWVTPITRQRILQALRRGHKWVKRRATLQA